MFKAAIFDLDGVITDTAVYHYRAWKTMAAGIGIEIDEAFNETLKGINRMDSLERILVHGGKAASFSEADRERLAAEKNAAYVASLATLTEADILPGIGQLLGDLRARGVKIGLASVSRNAERILIALKVSDLMDAIADAATVPRGKPAPDIFLEAARLLEVEPRDCIGIEDAVAGVEAIRSAGMIAVAVGEDGLLRAHGAQVVFAQTGLMTYEALVREVESLASWRG